MAVSAHFFGGGGPTRLRKKMGRVGARAVGDEFPGPVAFEAWRSPSWIGVSLREFFPPHPACLPVMLLSFFLSFQSLAGIFSSELSLGFNTFLFCVSPFCLSCFVDNLYFNFFVEPDSVP